MASERLYTLAQLEVMLKYDRDDYPGQSVFEIEAALREAGRWPYGDDETEAGYDDEILLRTARELADARLARAEKAEARVKELEAYAERIVENMLQMDTLRRCFDDRTALKRRIRELEEAGGDGWAIVDELRGRLASCAAHCHELEERLKAPARMGARIVVYTDRGGYWRWRMWSPEGQAIAQGPESWASHEAAWAAAEGFKAAAPTAEVIEECD